LHEADDGIPSESEDHGCHQKPQVARWRFKHITEGATDQREQDKDGIREFVRQIQRP